MKFTKESAAKVLLPLAVAGGVGRLVVANHADSAPKERANATAEPRSDYKPGDLGDPEILEPATTEAPTTTKAPTPLAPRKIEAPATTVTTEAPAEAPRTMEEITDSLLRPKVGQKTTYIKGAFNIREGAQIRSGLEADAPLTGDTTGLTLNPEFVKTDDGRTIACPTETSDTEGDATRQIRCVDVADLDGIDGASISNIVESTISFVDEANNTFTDDPAVPGYERPGGPGQQNQIRSFANESNDVITPQLVQD